MRVSVSSPDSSPLYPEENSPCPEWKVGYTEFAWSHTVVLYYDRVIYSVKTKHIYIYIYNHCYKFGNMFRFTEPSSGHFLIKSNGTFSGCAHVNDMGSYNVRTHWMYHYFVLRIGLKMVQWAETCRRLCSNDYIYVVFWLNKLLYQGTWIPKSSEAAEKSKISS